MAFDAMGNYTGYEDPALGETEDERRQRLLREAAEKRTPVKQTITTDPTTGQQTMTISGDVRDLSPQNPRTPTVLPVSPDMAAVRQVESGNRDFTPAGQPVTSPRGAMFASQVMPSTAAAPGFGVRPAQAQTPEEYNRVGQDYYNAMLQRYGGDREKALAAYNAGPGRVDQNLQANAGQLNTAQLPRETQGYVPRVLDKIISGLIPSAQAAEVPRAPVQPTAPAPVAPTAPQMAPQGQVTPAQISPVGAPATMPAPGAPTPAVTNYDDMLAKSLTDDKIRNQLITDPNTPAMYRRAAIANEQAAVQQQRDQQDAQKKAQEIIQTGNGREFAKAMKEEGSLLKAIFFGYAGAQDLARNELNKMGYGGKWESAMDENGQRALIKYRADGMPQEGFDQTGRPLSTQELAAFGTSAGALAKAETGKTLFRDPTGAIPGIITATYVPGQTTPIYTNQQGQRVRPASLTPITAATDVQSAYQTGYARAGGTAQGTQTAEGLQTTPLAAPPGIAGVPGTAGAPGTPTAPVQPGAVTAPTATPGVQVSPQGGVTPQRVDGVVSALPATATARPTTGTGPVAPVYQQKQNIAINEKDREAFVKYTNDDLIPKADAGSKLAGIRRDQIAGPDGVLNNPEIAGLLSGTGSKAREFQNLFRDIVAGNFEKVDDMSSRIKATGLDPRMKEVLQIQLQRQREVTPLLIREVAPVGSITDFEQRMAKDAGVDITRQGLYASLTNLTRNQFQSDMAAYKAAFKANNPQLQTREQFESAWQTEKARLDAVYKRVYEDRARYIGKYNADGSNNNATVVAFRDHYPVPQFNQETKQWDFKGYSRNALKPKLSEFER